MNSNSTAKVVRAPVCWSPFGTVLLALAALAVLLTGFDAVTATLARARGAAPTFLFTFVLPGLCSGAGRLVSLAAQLALPALAVGLPALLTAWMLLAGRRAAARGAALRPAALLGAALLVLGGLADAAFYRALGAVPSGDATATPAGRRAPREPKEPQGPDGAVAADPAPTALPGTEKIFFTSDRSGQQHIWMMNPDGSGQEQLSRTDRVHMEPRLSPDGGRLSFSSFSAAGKLTVCLLDLAKREEKEICEGAQAAFTGDGKGLVLRRSDQIFLHELGSGTEKMISPKMWSRCSYPSASPDGASVAMASRLLAGYNIYILPLAGGGEPKLLVGGEGTCDPRWAPSGRQLSYQTESHIFTIRPDGSDKLQVTFGGGVQHYACFSPDEKRLAYCQGPGRDGPWQIYTTSLIEDEDPLVLTKEGSNIYPDWGRPVLGADK